MIIDGPSNTGMAVNPELKEALKARTRVEHIPSYSSVTIYNDWRQYKKKNCTRVAEFIPELVTQVQTAHELLCAQLSRYATCG